MPGPFETVESRLEVSNHGWTPIDTDNRGPTYNTYLGLARHWVTTFNGLTHGRLGMDENLQVTATQRLPEHGTSGAPKAEGSPPIAIPDHTLLRRIGRGSYGEVWLARHTMGMYRAVKIVFRASFKEQRPFDRELSGIRKFEPISRSHEGFMDVLHVGLNDGEGYFYYVMELGDDEHHGQTIEPDRYSPKTLAKEISQRGQLPFDECLKLGLALSQALAELHKHGLVHRDVKPSNLIFVNGVPKLADIGLVAEVNEEHSYVGTQGFIPPEGPGTIQADIYSLGKVLYEASTARDRQDFPELPTLLTDFPDRDRLLELNEVVLTACANDPSRRYQTAWDMHAHLLVLANGKSVRRLKALEAMLARLKRIAGILVLAALVAGLATYQLYRAWKGKLENKQRQVGADVAYGTRSLDSGDLAMSLPYFVDALRLDEGDQSREQTDRFRVASVLSQCPKLTYFWVMNGEAQDALFSPDGTRLLMAQYCGKAQVYDFATEQFEGQPFSHQSSLRGVAYSPDGRFVLTANEEGSACLWDASTHKELRHFPQPCRVYSARFSPDGTRIITSAKDGVARVWDSATGELRLELKGHKDGVLFADFSKDGRLLVTTSRDATARIWDATDGRPLSPPLPHDRWVTHACFSPDGKELATSSDDHRARVWEVATGRRIPPDLPHLDVVKSVEFSPDGRWILTGSLDGTAALWAADTHQPLNPNPVLRHSGRVNNAAFSPDGHRVVTMCEDGTVRVWDLAASMVAPVPERVAFSANRSHFLAPTGLTLQVLATASREPVSPLIQASAPVLQSSLSYDGQFVLALCDSTSNRSNGQQTAEIWETATGKRAMPPIAVPAGATNLSVSKDGKVLMFCDDEGIQIRNLASGAQAVVRGAKPQGAVFNSAGTVAASWSETTVNVFDVTTGQRLFGPLTHPFPVKAVQFNPDGSRLVTCGADDGLHACYAQVWDARSGQPIGPRLAHRDGVLAACFSPDGSRIATASEDFTASIWDTATGGLVSSGMAHGDQVNDAAFSPNGRWLVTASADGTARVWNAENGEPLTPPLRHLLPVITARLPAGKDVVLVTTERGKRSWIWHLPVDDRPTTELADISELLSAQRISSSGRLAPAQLDALKALWTRLRASHPAQFTVSRGEIAAWHEFQSEDCELREQWSGAIFHLEQLMKLHPGEEALAARLVKAREHLTAPH